MKTNKIVKNWPVFLFLIALTSGLFCYLTSQKTKPTRSEKIVGYVSALEVNNKEIVSSINQVKSDVIRKVEIKSNDVTKSDSVRYFDAISTSVDFYIIPETYMNVSYKRAIKYTIEEINEVIPYSVETTLYAYEGNNYGIKIYDKETKVGKLTNFITYNNETFNENYYLVLSNSAKLIDMNKENDHGEVIKSINYLLSL